jgi:hypothetical protein
LTVASTVYRIVGFETSAVAPSGIVTPTVGIECVFFVYCGPLLFRASSHFSATDRAATLVRAPPLFFRTLVSRYDTGTRTSDRMMNATRTSTTPTPSSGGTGDRLDRYR